MPKVTKPSTQARRNREFESRRGAVLDAAEAVFQSHGYLAATTDAIAERAGVSVGTVYNFYGNKEGVFAAVIERVGRDMAAHARETASQEADVCRAVQELVRFRLEGFERQRLFLALFSCERVSGAYPDPDAISKEAKVFYYRYLDSVAGVFQRGMDAGVFERTRPLHLALSFEGVLTAFVGYWSRPEQNQPPEAQVRRITETFMRMAGLRKVSDTAAASRPDLGRRDVYVTSFDFDRLTELIAVARGFGGEGAAPHLSELERALLNGKVVEPRLAPPDVITMNSRVRLAAVAGGEEKIVTLVFPVDRGKAEENLSVLEPLGTALLGRRVGAVVEAPGESGAAAFRVEELLYQPESSGDFHR